jgi:hypothetical protein
MLIKKGKPLAKSKETDKINMNHVSVMMKSERKES